MFSIYGSIDGTIVLLDVVEASDAVWAVSIACKNFPTVADTIFALTCSHISDAA